jgi:hypothetical protein
MQLPCRPRRQGPIKPRWCVQAVQAVQAQSFVVRSPPSDLTRLPREDSAESSRRRPRLRTLSKSVPKPRLTLSRRFRLQAARWSATLRAFQAAMRTPARPATLAAEAHGALQSALGLAGSACACARDYRNLTIVSRICAAFLQRRGGLWRAKLCWWQPRKYQLREGAQLFSVLSSEG